MSKGTLTTAQAERSAHHIMRNKLNIRNVQLIFSVIMFLTFAGPVSYTHLDVYKRQQ